MTIEGGGYHSTPHNFYCAVFFMRISELARHQKQWEKDRGIKNGEWGVQRIQQELDEARAEGNLRDKLVELADVIIIATGSAGILAEYLGMEVEALESIIHTKLKINDIKYDLEEWDLDDVEGSIRRAKDSWLL